MENATNQPEISVSDERVTFTVSLVTGKIHGEYADGSYGYWDNYHDMIGDRDLATKLARKIRSRAPHLV